jgi:phosphatidylglycerophosphate synthase
VRAAADFLTALRLLLGVAFPAVLARGGPWPLLVWLVAAGSDYVDGPLARRARSGSRHGRVLDPVADVVFVLSGLGAAAVWGMVPWVVPCSVVASVSAYAWASWRTSRQAHDVRLAHSAVGHAAGVVNYLCVGAIAARDVLAPTPWTLLVALAATATVALNTASVATRLLGGQLPRRAT